MQQVYALQENYEAQTASKMATFKICCFSIKMLIVSLILNHKIQNGVGEKHEKIDVQVVIDNVNTH